ncbi:MAG TPA: fimbrial biogenesis outer membrane usher protein, partial [Brevundimonas sp.]|nr:fimbrial biogenesis outer membrane usher protein [Brevundimonas sp.]
ANLQADEASALVGVEAIFGTSIGTFGVQFAASQNDFAPSGEALTVTFQRLLQLSNGRSDSFNLSYQYRSEWFGPAGGLPLSNPFSHEIGMGYTHAFTDDVYAGIDLRHSIGRGNQPDFSNYRGTLGWRLSPTISLTTDILYEDGLAGSELAALVGLTFRLGAFSSVRADYDTRDERVRLGYQTLSGQGVGSYSASADIEDSENGSGFNGAFNYIANRAELGVAHFTTFENGFGSTVDERTSLRIGTAIAFADGAVSVGRPIFDSFAIVRGHRSLEGAEILVEPTPLGYEASTGALGTAITPNLPSYSAQTITINAPDAPVGADLGTGAFRVFPPYRSGYLLTVGSDYSFSAVGTLVGLDGAPLALVSGTATEVGAPDREPITLFTNRAGRFGLSGLRAGRWRLDMLGEEPATYYIDVPETAAGVLRFENLQPSRGN